MWFAPCHPYLRSYLEIHTATAVSTREPSRAVRSWSAASGTSRSIAKELISTEFFDPARTGIRGCTVHGHSLRLDEDGMMFDMLARRVLDKDGIVKYVKNQIGEPLDKAVKVGKPMDEKWLKAHTTIYNSNGGTGFRDDKEYDRVHPAHPLAADQVRLHADGVR